MSFFHKKNNEQEAAQEFLPKLLAHDIYKAQARVKSNAALNLPTDELTQAIAHLDPDNFPADKDELAQRRISDVDHSQIRQEDILSARALVSMAKRLEKEIDPVLAYTASLNYLDFPAEIDETKKKQRTLVFESLFVIDELEALLKKIYEPGASVYDKSDSAEKIAELLAPALLKRREQNHLDY